MLCWGDIFGPRQTFEVLVIFFWVGEKISVFAKISGFGNFFGLGPKFKFLVKILGFGKKFELGQKILVLAKI